MIIHNPQPRGCLGPKQPREGDDCEACFYCGLLFANMRHEHDHAPIPVRAGGEAIVPACLNCHELKDRQPIDMWHTRYAMEGMCDLIARGLIPMGDETSFPPEWPSMGLWSRLVWAKMAAHAHDGRVLGVHNSIPALWVELDDLSTE